MDFKDLLVAGIVFFFVFKIVQLAFFVSSHPICKTMGSQKNIKTIKNISFFKLASVRSLGSVKNLSILKES